MATKRLFSSTDQFQRLLDCLKNDGIKLIGPTIRNDVIICSEIQSAQDLPIGWMDEQNPGYYRLKRRNDRAYFGYNLGPHSWKQFLFPPREKLLTARKQPNGMLVFQETAPNIEKMAFIGVHACEIQAILIQDKVFQTKLVGYKQYQQRRDNILIIAVQCTRSVNTCFCASMKTGPAVTAGYDLALTEVIDQNEHYFVVDVGSMKGQALCERLSLREAAFQECQLAHQLIEKNRSEMVRQVDNEHVHEMLNKSWDCKRWDQVAERCVNCANCTMVCPTCFCSEMEDRVAIDQGQDDRWQYWDSCFNLSHSYIHGGSVRQSARSRYRQWLTHKFGTWWDQFGTSGCVGCGRCITWCPVGIDVTEELRELKNEGNACCCRKNTR